MTKHIFLIDPLEKLVFKKDSSLMLALTMQEMGKEVYLLFEKDFYYSNQGTSQYKVFHFTGQFEEDDCYLKTFSVGDQKLISLETQDTIHMRIDPPFDSRYLRYLWMLKSINSKGVSIINDPRGILLYNEKLFAYEQKESLESYVGSSKEAFMTFIETIKKQGHEHIILKPLDLFQGIGVEKVAIDENIENQFIRKIREFSGPVVAQPFAKEVLKGEVRSIFFNGQELGSILKVPKEGEFLANIAQGAKYSEYKLTKTQKSACERICHELLEHGVGLVAFDILGESISEVNITCPGLLVEVSKAVGQNLARVIAKTLP